MHYLLDLPTLLRRLRPAEVHFDGQAIEMPESRKRWQRVLQLAQHERPNRVTLYSHEGEMLAELESDDESDESASTALAFGTDSDIPTSWAALAAATTHAYAALLDSERAFRKRALESQQRVHDEQTAGWRTLLEAQQAALTSVTDRAQHLEDLVTADLKRYALRRDENEDDDRDDSTLVTSVSQILQLAPHLAPLLQRNGHHG